MQCLVSRMENPFPTVQAGAWLSREDAESVGSFCLYRLLWGGLRGALPLLCHTHADMPHPTLSCSLEPLSLPWLLPALPCPHLVSFWGIMGCDEGQGCFMGSWIWDPPCRAQSHPLDLSSDTDSSEVITEDETMLDSTFINLM